jgi:hypothetical protein
MDTDAVRKAPNENSARMGAKLQLLFVPGTIAGVAGFGYAVDGPPVSERILALLMLLMLVGGIAMIAGFVGLVLICDALVRDPYRAPWFFWFLIVYGPLLLFVLPWGTPFGIFFIIYALMRRRQFFQPDTSRVPAV